MSSTNASADLILVRHGRPAIDPETPPWDWRLSSEGYAAVDALAGRLAHMKPAEIVASTEPKAIETATVIARACRLVTTADTAFDEHRRPGWPFEADPAAQATRVLRALAEPGRSIEGAEPGEAAAARFAAGLAARQRRPLIVVSHGAVISLYVAGRAGLDAQDLWRSLSMPDALLLDASGKLIGRIA